MKPLLILFSGLFTLFSVSAEENIEQEITAALAGLIPDIKVDSVRAAPVEGLYQVLMGTDVIYMSRDGNYVLKGELLDINLKRNLTEDVRSGARLRLIEGIDKNEYIEFAPEKSSEAIYVFTDVECGYCRKLHRDVPELNARGVSVRYLAFPRNGVDSAVGREMRQVWCAEDRQAAITAAKNRESVAAASCNDPVARHYALGRQLGIRGTPAIYLENGRMLPGYLTPDELEYQLQLQ